MDKLEWFKFSPSSYMMGRIQRCSEVAQARFIRLCCSYWNHKCEMTHEDAEIDLGKDVTEELIRGRVLVSDSEYIYIHFLDDQFADIVKNKHISSEKGSIGNLKRWHKATYTKYVNGELSLEEAISVAKGSGGDHTPIDTRSLIIADKKREEKKRKEKNFDLFWSKYPKKADKAKAKKKFLTLNDEEVEKILSTIDAFSSHKPFESYSHPNPTTYLNGKRWEDEIQVKNGNYYGHKF